MVPWCPSRGLAGNHSLSAATTVWTGSWALRVPGLLGWLKTSISRQRARIGKGKVPVLSLTKNKEWVKPFTGPEFFGVAWMLFLRNQRIMYMGKQCWFWQLVKQSALLGPLWVWEVLAAPGCPLGVRLGLRYPPCSSDLWAAWEWSVRRAKESQNKKLQPHLPQPWKREWVSIL